MKLFEFGKKNQSSHSSVPAENVKDTFIQPFQEMPSSSTNGQESADRLQAHDLFSFYTADIIKEDTIFTR